MGGSKDRIKTQIDFSVTRGHINSNIIYTVLMKYNRGCNTQMTASQLIAEAFRKYDSSEPIDVTLLYDTRTRALAFKDIYNVENKKDIMRVIKEASFKDEPELLEPGKKFFCFDAGDDSVTTMWKYLSAIRFRDRACVINRMLFQYFAHGNCKIYTSLCAERLLYWMKEEFEQVYELDRSKLDYTIECLWNNCIEEAEEEDDEPEEEKSVEEPVSDEDKLRKIMGLL